MEQASHQVRKAYALMRKPPEFELYDLKNDPYEFQNLAEDSSYAAQRAALKQALKQWQTETHDPLKDSAAALQLFEMIQGSDLKRSLLPYKNFMTP